ncbi:hypothetical protein [Amycolatopsis rifamycinica]|uniref:Uncharacterized protein n=1 Tax=Amycolatopsis rifamycinica TaxID=287986 RepID=A0A066UF40_9PSEU|nr:hypothetical protein [Amycolatopsis rifamycinica]KDN22838.1 hypothetical protein DV20_07320 [Amycolatopsis rifamycinica]
MQDHNLPTSGQRGWFDRLLDRLGAWLFATEEDARAEARGWEVRRGARGTRVYRDPRWDTVHACTSCGGHGLSLTDGAACPACAGTGVVRRAPATAVPVADGCEGARS